MTGYYLYFFFEKEEEEKEKYHVLKTDSLAPHLLIPTSLKHEIKEKFLQKK